MKRTALALVSLSLALSLGACLSTGGGSGGDAQAGAGPNAAKARAIELVQGESSSGASTAATDTAADGTATTDSTAAAPAVAAGNASDTVSAADVADGAPTPEELKFLDNYLAGLRWMVYYDDSGEPVIKDYARTAVTMANRYLIEQLKVQAVDLDTVEKKKADERAAWQAETGQSVDYIQFIAQKLNADLYLGLSIRLSEFTNGGRYYATVTVSGKFYNASTGELLGSMEIPSPKVMSPDSQDQANTGAISTTVSLAVARISSQAKELLRAAWKDGIRYDITMQGTPDAKAIGQLKRELGKRFRKVTQESYSAQETRWSINTFKRADSIEEIMYDAAETVGMRDLYLVFQRGKAFVFNTGN